uniref:Uncharacterized protein n=1 Tax=Romanomermis culicivorax TaxID=13658 RepID=A0A915KEA9_ROMCU
MECTFITFALRMGTFLYRPYRQRDVAKYASFFWERLAEGYKGHWKLLAKIINDRDGLTGRRKLVLHRHRQAEQDQTRPFELKLTEQATPSVSKEEVDAGKSSPEKDELYQKTMKIVPKKWHSQADILYDYATNNPHMEWSDKGEMIINGNKITGTNIVDLISDVVRMGSKRQPALGADIFVKNLIKENVPRDVFVNKSRLNVGSDAEDVYASPVGPPSARKKKITQLGSSTILSKLTRRAMGGSLASKAPRTNVVVV